LPYAGDERQETTMKNGDKVVQMIPAAGYYAAYRDGERISYNPVAAWVVIEDQQGRQRVDGVDPSGGNWDGSPCGYARDFVEFVYRDERERRR
jgi:hypothetical protein